MSTSTVKFRETLHELNQRYKQAWDRAERLQDELNDIKNSRAYRLVRWLRQVAGILRPADERTSASRFQFERLCPSSLPVTGIVSILIPFKNHADLLQNCVQSIFHSTFRSFEIVLLDNGSTCPHTLRYLEEGQGRAQFRVVRCAGPFNFSRVCNLGARYAQGEFLLFLNNDMETLSPDWLEHMLQLANRPDVGVTGATLLYPDRTIQHAGIYPDGAGEWRHVHRGFLAEHPGESGELTHPRSVPAVTGACLLIRRRLFEEIGGFDESFPLTHNDIDLCIRVRRRGLKVAISPHARLWHFESMSRGYSRELLTLP